MKSAKITLRIAIALILVSGLSSCKKETLELLSGTTWEFENYTTTSENPDIQTWVTLGKGILTDGTLTFSEDGSYEITSPIMENQQIAETGTWELIGSSQLILTTGGVPRTVSIDEITKNRLVYFETYIYLDTETYTIKNVWVK